jgi:hypothetical protein
MVDFRLMNSALYRACQARAMRIVVKIAAAELAIGTLALWQS